MKKRSYWVLFAVMILVGAFLMVFLASQNQLPVVTNVDAQMSNMGSYVSSGSYISGNLGSHGSLGMSLGGIDGAGTFATCQSQGYGSCFGIGIGVVMGMVGQGFGQRLESESTPTGVLPSPTTFNCTGSVCVGGINTMLFCPTSMNCGSQTSLNCTGLICGGGVNTMLFCPTSTICGGQTSLNCTVTTGLVCGSFTSACAGIFTSGICSSGGSKTSYVCGGGYTYGQCSGTFVQCTSHTRKNCLPIHDFFGGETMGHYACGSTYGGMCGYDGWAGTGYQGISGYTATPGW